MDGVTAIHHSFVEDLNKRFEGEVVTVNKDVSRDDFISTFAASGGDFREALTITRKPILDAGSPIGQPLPADVRVEIASAAALIWGRHHKAMREFSQPDFKALTYLHKVCSSAPSHHDARLLSCRVGTIPLLLAETRTVDGYIQARIRTGHVCLPAGTPWIQACNADGYLCQPDDWMNAVRRVEHTALPQVIPGFRLEAPEWVKDDPCVHGVILSMHAHEDTVTMRFMDDAKKISYLPMSFAQYGNDAALFVSHGVTRMYATISVRQQHVTSLTLDKQEAKKPF